MTDDALRADLAELALRTGDDRLVLGHRLSEWIGFAPVLEEELAIGNVALDLLGQAEDRLARAGELGAGGGAARTADELAFFRDVTRFRNALLVEQENGDFARTVARSFLFDVWDVHWTSGLEGSCDADLARFGARAAKEAAYHLRHSREWVLRLGDGTEESHARMQRAIDELWRHGAELFESDPVIERLVAARAIPDPAALVRPWREIVEATLREATLDVPADDPRPPRGGRHGRHGEALGRMLSEMQSLARAFPGATW